MTKANLLHRTGFEHWEAIVCRHVEGFQRVSAVLRGFPGPGAAPPAARVTRAAAAFINSHPHCEISMECKT